MAPVPEAYFPSLDKCFSGDVQLLSWQRTFLYTNNVEESSDHGASIPAFLSHPDSIELLSQSLIPFARPSAKSKSEFESKTAAIHVETKSKSSFDLEEIKADALWLSEKAQLDEITALRVTVLEWQERPATRLTTSYSPEEATSLQSATGADNLRVSVTGPSFVGSLRTNADTEGASSFTAESNRRLRLRKLYLSERSHALKTFRKLLAFSLHDLSSESARSKGNEGDRKLALCKLGVTIFHENSAGEGLSRLLEDCMTGIRKRLKDLEGDGGWLGESESNQEIEDVWRTTLVEEIVHILQIMFHQLQAASEVPSGSLLISWLDLMLGYDFLMTLQVPCQQQMELLQPLRTFTSLATSAFFKTMLCINHVYSTEQPQTIPPGKAAYFLCKESVSQINERMLTACTEFPAANVAAYCWSAVLRSLRESIAESPRPGIESTYQDILDSAQTPKFTADSAIAQFTSPELLWSLFEFMADHSNKAGSVSAIDDGLTFQWVRLAFLDILRLLVAGDDVKYPLSIDLALAILTYTSTDSSWISASSVGSASDPRFVFVRTDNLMDSIFRLARSHFPIEMVPFLKLCRVLVSEYAVNEDGLPSIIEELDNMGTFTEVVPPYFQGYETIREDENANLVTLTQPLPMIQAGSRNRLSENDASNALVVSGTSEVPVSTIGEVISDDRPALVMWQHEYSGLSFLGAWLEEQSQWGLEDMAVPGTEVIGLLADLVASARKSSTDDRASINATRVLEMASDGLSRQGDIISLVLDIFERGLQSAGSRGDSAEALRLITTCLQFIEEVLHVLPNRIWPFFSRSGFIGSDGKGGVMTAVISALEVPSGDFTFLLSCVDVFSAAVDDAASRAVLRKCPGSVTGKSTIASDWSAGVPSHIMRSILLNLTRTMVDIFSSIGNWRFSISEQKFKMNARLATAFEQILYYNYGINESEKREAKITGVFSDAAAYILDMLRPRSPADLPFNPLLRLISDGLQNPPTLYLRYLSLIEDQVNSTLELCIKLVEAARVAEQPGSVLEEQLFKATPVLVKLYALSDVYRLSVVSLLGAIISRAASNPDQEPPSLVGHLGAESSCLFLDVLSQLDRPFSDDALLLAIWRLLSTFVSKRQQWLAVFILTGASPRQSLKKSVKSGDPKMRGVPFLRVALDKLATIEQEDPQIALAMLEFVSTAQENWPWATPHMKDHPEFFKSIVRFVSKLNISSLPASDQIFITRIAAVVADICAVYLHAAKEMGDWSFVKILIPLVQWYGKDAVDVAAYNSSLHSNLKKNFEMRYAGCSINDFKRTSLTPRALGREYCYSLEMGAKLLSYDFAWNGTRNRGFAEEFERANMNLSLVEAQVTLLNSWKFLATEHCADFMPDYAIQKSMAGTVQNCLEANTRNPAPEAIFKHIQQVRVDFAQTLLQRLVEIGSRGNEVYVLLEVAWTALRDRHKTYEEALVSDDIDYYRSLLNVLFLALQFHLDDPLRLQPNQQARISRDWELGVEISRVIVAQGFKSLTTYLHEAPEKCTPKDFAIIIAILQSCLRVRDAELNFEHVAYQIAENDVVRHATTLFSWADQLAIAGDPVYGELSVSLLVKLSALPNLAEHLAVEAVLMKLSSCRLTNILRQPKGFGPFDPVPRLYTIWSAGFLPLCLNLLYNVVRATPEVSAFLNQFEGQLTRASESFSIGTTASSQWISLSMASEAYSLALMSFIIHRFREAGASAALDASSIQELQWDQSQVKGDIEDLLGRRAFLRGRIVATNEKEVEWSRQKPVSQESGAENRLEEKVVRELQAAVACLGGDEDS